MLILNGMFQNEVVQLICDFEKNDPMTNLFKPNSAILFKSNIWHYADPPSLQSNIFRITLAYKLRIYEKNTFDYFEKIK